MTGLGNNHCYTITKHSFTFSRRWSTSTCWQHGIILWLKIHSKESKSVELMGDIQAITKTRRSSALLSHCSWFSFFICIRLFSNLHRNGQMLKNYLRFALRHHILNHRLLLRSFLPHYSMIHSQTGNCRRILDAFLHALVFEGLCEPILPSLLTW